MSSKPTPKSVKIATLELGDEADASWHVERDDRDAVSVRVANDDRDTMSLDLDRITLRKHSTVAGNVQVPGNLALPLDVDYMNAHSRCLVPKSVADAAQRRPAFTRSLTHARVTDSNPYATRKTDDIMTRANGKWGPMAISRGDPPTQLAFHTLFTPADVYDNPQFRTASFGYAPYPASTNENEAIAIVHNAFPAPTPVSINNVRVSLANLQIPSTAGSTCKIRVTLRILDSAVDTGMYKGEVVRELDVTHPDESVDLRGQYSDGKWNWAAARDLSRYVDVAAYSAVRVQIRVILTEFAQQTETSTHGTVCLTTAPATFASDAFGGSVGAPIVTGTTISVTHGITQTVGNNMGVVCRVYTAPKNQVTASEIYTIMGSGASNLAASSAFLVTGGDGIYPYHVATGPLVFPGLANGVYYVYVLAKGSSGAFSTVYEHQINTDATPPTLSLTTTTANPATSSVTVQARFSKPVAGFTLEGVSVANGTPSGLIGSGDSYTFTVMSGSAYTPTTVTVGAGAYTDLVGNANTEVAALTFTYTPYDPATDPDLLAWYDPSDPSTTFADVEGAIPAIAGGAVMRMNDKGPNGYHVTQASAANSPIVDASNLNSRRSLRFVNGSSTVLKTATETFWDRPNNTIVFVAQQSVSATYPGTGTALRGLIIGPAGGMAACYHVDDQAVYGFCNTAYRRACTRGEFFDGRGHVFSISANTSATVKKLYTWIDGRLGGLIVGTPSQPGGPLNIGGEDGSAFEFFDGWIGEILVYGAEKQAQDASDLIRRYLVAKWGTPATFIPDTAKPVLSLSNSPSGSHPTTLPITVTAAFDEIVTGFTSTGVAITGGSLSFFSGSGTTYTFLVTPSAPYTETTVTVHADAAFDPSANGNAETVLRFTYTPPPSVTLTMTGGSFSPTSAPVSVTATFSEPVVGFDVSDVTVVSNGTASNLSGGGAVYTFDVTPDHDGTPTSVRVDAGRVTDAIGSANTASNILTFTYIANPILTFDFGNAANVFSDNGVTMIADNQPIQQVRSSTGPYTLTYEPGTSDAYRPVWNNGGLNGKSYCTLVGDPIARARGQLTSSYASAGGEYTAIWVEYLYSYWIQDGWGWEAGTAGKHAYVARDPDNGAYGFPCVFRGSSADDVTSIDYDLAGTYPSKAYVIAYRVSASEKSVWHHGKKRRTTTATLSPAINAIRFGATNAPQNQTRIGEFQWFDRAISDTRLIEIAAAMDAKWSCGTWTDNTTPTVSLSTSVSYPTLVPVTVTAVFSEPVKGFALDDVVVTNGTASGLTNVGMQTFTFAVTPTTEYAVTNVTVAGDVVIDEAEDGNAASNQLAFTYTPPPTVVLSTTAGASPTTSPVAVTATFNAPVTGFDSSDVSVTNGTVTSVSGSGAVYTVTVTPTTAYSQTAVSVGANAALINGVGNTASNQLAFTYTPPPTVVLSTTAGANPTTSPVTVTATFSAAVTGFDSSDVSVTNGTVTSVSGSGAVYTVTVTPTTAYSQTAVSVGANAALINGVGNTASNQLAFTYTPPPTIVLSAAAGSYPTTSPVAVTATFSAPVTGFGSSDVSVTNGTVTSVSGSGSVYTVTVTPTTAYSQTAVSVGANAALINGVGNTASNQLAFTYTPPPTVVLSTTAGANPTTSPVAVTATFSAAVTGFDSSDVSVTNGTVTSVSGSGAVYTITVTPVTAGSLTTVSIGADAAFINGVGNAASNQLAFTYTIQPVLAFDFGDVTRVFSDNGVTPISAGQSIQQVNSTVGNHTLTYNNVGYTGTRPIWESGKPENGSVTRSYCRLRANSTSPRGQLVSSYQLAGGEFTVFFVGYVTVSWGLSSGICLMWSAGTAASFTGSDRVNKPITLAGSGISLSAGLYDPLDAGTMPTPGFVHVLRVSATEKSVWYRGSKRSWTASTPVTANNQIAIGASTDKQNNFAMCEFIWYDVALPDTAVASIAQGLDTKWGCGTWSDAVSPTVLLSTPSLTPSTNPVTVTATFTEQVQNMALTDITVTNGTASGLTNQGLKVFTFSVTATTPGSPTTVSIPANSATDLAGNGNQASNQLSFTYTPPPTVVLSTTAGASPASSPIAVTATFSVPVTGFDSSDVSVTNGTVTSVSGSGAVYTLTVEPTTAYSQTTVSIGANTAFVNGVGNAASNQLAFTYIPYNPGADPTLIAWYDPSDDTTLFSVEGMSVTPQIGGTVGMMQNKAQDAYHMTQASLAMRPIRATNTGAVASSWLEFITYPDRRVLALPSTTSFFNTGSRTIAFVAKQRYTSSPHPAPYTFTGTSISGLMLNASGGNAPVIAYHSAQTVRVSAISGSNTDIATRADFFDDQAHVIQLRYNRGANQTTTWDSCFDTSRSATVTVNSVLTAQGFQIGGDSSLDVRAFDGWIGEILVFNGYKTPEQQDEIREYLKARWNTE